MAASIDGAKLCSRPSAHRCLSNRDGRGLSPSVFGQRQQEEVSPDPHHVPLEYKQQPPGQGCSTRPAASQEGGWALSTRLAVPKLCPSPRLAGRGQPGSASPQQSPGLASRRGRGKRPRQPPRALPRELRRPARRLPEPERRRQPVARGRPPGSAPPLGTRGASVTARRGEGRTGKEEVLGLV